MNLKQLTTKLQEEGKERMTQANNLIFNDKLLEPQKYLDEQLALLIQNTINQTLAYVSEEVEGMKKSFTPADNIQVGGIESDEFKLIPKENGMYCLNCGRFTLEEGCICGMVSITDIQKILEVKE